MFELCTVCRRALLSGGSRFITIVRCYYHHARVDDSSGVLDYSHRWTLSRGVYTSTRGSDWRTLNARVYVYTDGDRTERGWSSVRRLNPDEYLPTLARYCWHKRRARVESQCKGRWGDVNLNWLCGYWKGTGLRKKRKEKKILQALLYDILLSVEGSAGKRSSECEKNLVSKHGA